MFQLKSESLSGTGVHGGMVMKKKYKVYQVTWVDTSSSSAWRDIKNFKPTLYTINSAGYLIYEDKKVIVLSLAISDDDRSSDRLTIPKGCIVRMLQLYTKDTA